MGHNNDCLLAEFNELVEGLLDLVLALGIQSTGSFVQEQDFRLSDEGAGDGNTLLLTSRKLNSSSANECFITVGEELGVFDEIVDRRLFASLIEHLCDLSFTFTVSVSLFNAVEDVVPDSVVEEDGLLLDNSHLTVVPSTVQSSDVTSVESHCALKWQVELLQHGYTTGLSATTSTDEGDDFLVLVVDFKGDSIKCSNVHLFRVRESYVVQGKVSIYLRVVFDSVSVLVDDGQLFVLDLLKTIVDTLNSQNVTDNEGKYPELENQDIGEEEVLSHFSESNLSRFGEFVGHVADNN